MNIQIVGESANYVCVELGLSVAPSIVDRGEMMKLLESLRDEGLRPVMRLADRMICERLPNQCSRVIPVAGPGEEVAIQPGFVFDRDALDQMRRGGIVVEGVQYQYDGSELAANITDDQIRAIITARFTKLSWNMDEMVRLARFFIAAEREACIDAVRGYLTRTSDHGDDVKAAEIEHGLRARGQG